MKTANELRAQALDLLQQAELLDGKKPWAVSLGGSDLDAPMSFVCWSATKLTDAEACEATGTDEDAFNDDGIELSVRRLPLSDLLPKPC